MQPNLSKSTAVAKAGALAPRVRYNDPQGQAILAYFDENGYSPTMRKFGLKSNAPLYRLVRERNQAKGTIDVKVVEPKAVKTTPMVQHTAKHLRMLLRKRRKETDEPDELEIYCWLLVKELIA